MLSSLFKGKYIKLFDEAAAHNRADIYRKGDYIVLPPKGDTMISGDIHGNMENFDILVQKADLSRHPERHLVVHELVHNIYRGNFMADKSFDILVWAAELKCEFPNNFHYVTGNHELAEIQGKAIMKNGAKIPLVFGTTDQKKRKKGDYGSKLKTSAINYLRSLVMGVRHRGGIWMSHSIPSKAMHEFSLSLFDGKTDQDELGTLAASQRAYKEQVLEDLTWGRDFNDTLVQSFKEKVKARLLVIGHEPQEKGWGTPHPDMLILDSTAENGTFLHIQNDKPYNKQMLLKSLRRIKNN